MLTSEEIFYTVIFTSAFFLLLTIIIIYAAYYNYKRKQKYLMDKIVFEKMLLTTQIEIREQTLQHISRELHDNFSQIASLIKINLNTIQLTDTTKASEKIEEAKDHTRRLISDIKSLSVSLSGDSILSKGLAKSLELEVGRLNKTGEFIATFKKEERLPAINTDKAIILYRMVQEALNNIIKHSNAKHVNVFLYFDEKFFTLAVSDDGIGFDVDEKRNSGGAGLLNLQNRAKLINAQLTVISTPGNGSKITIQLPV